MPRFKSVGGQLPSRPAILRSGLGGQCLFFLVCRRPNSEAAEAIISKKKFWPPGSTHPRSWVIKRRRVEKKQAYYKGTKCVHQLVLNGSGFRTARHAEGDGLLTTRSPYVRTAPADLYNKTVNVNRSCMTCNWLINSVLQS